jgi:trehalose 6-phosphate phosphatase
MRAQTSSAQHWQTTTETLLRTVLKAKRLGLVTDMDGTISHPAETPEAAVVTPRNRELLGTFVLMLPLVAVVSGRAVRDLQARVAIPGVVYVGNHGLERWVDGGRVLNEDVRQHRKALVSAMDELRPHLTVGMWLEDKYATASLHYRLTPQPEKAAQFLTPLVQEVVARYGLDMQLGKRLFEIRPPIEANKGTVLARLVEEYQLDAVIYVGDSLSDVDALNMARKLRGMETCYALGAGVVHPNNSTDISQAVSDAADFVTNDVNDVESFLGWLLEALSHRRV